MSDEPGLLASLLPPGVAAADILDQDQAVTLRADEAVFVASAGEKRRRDFTLGRHCAHLALERLGVAASALLPSPQGAPLWPEGVAGSITHTNGYAAAIAAPRRLFHGLGVDAERVGGVSDKLFARVFTARECARLEGLAPDARAAMAAILFSAKEAHHKAANTASPLRFRDLLVTLDGNRLLVRGADGMESEGACTVKRGLAIVVAARAA